MKVVRAVLLFAALLVIAAATLTPGASGFPATARPDFWCLACGEWGGADVVANFALFVPLGIALALIGVSPVRVLLYGALLSSGIELAQRYGFPPARVANATDVLTNTIGAFVGALVLHGSRHWRLPTKKHATLLMAGSAALVLGVLALSGWALSPLPRATFAIPLEQSAYPFTPGYGWYHGRVSRVTFDATTFTHVGDGPVILREATHDVSRMAQVELRGRDERAEFVPFLYVHGASVAQPELLLGQEGDDARLSVRLRGSRLRLPGPHAILPGAFANAGAELHMIKASVTPALWSIESRRGGARAVTNLRLSLGLGWTLFQTVVRPAQPAAIILSALWMFGLAMPLGYFCAFGGGVLQSPSGMFSRTGSYQALLAGVCVLILTLTVIPLRTGIAASSWVEWVAAFAGFASGVLFASRVWRTQQRLEALRLGHQRLSPLQ